MERKPKFWISAWIAFLFGSTFGGLIGARGGAELATSRDRDGSVSRAEYYRMSDECERIGMLYEAERERNVLLTSKHLTATQVVKLKSKAR